MNNITRAFCFIIFFGWLLPFTSAHAATYYVANAGNDSCTGTAATIAASGTCAWKTIGKVNAASLQAGDTVLFNKGDTWNEQLTVSGNGSSGSPITYSSYGSGALPHITGLTTLSAGWVNEGGNIWRYDLSAYPSTTTVRYLLLNGTNQQVAQSAVRYATTGTTGSFTDPTLGGTDGDYVGAEVLMRSTSFTWDIRTVSAYTSATGVVSFTPSNSYGLGTTGDSVGGYFFQHSLKVLQQNAVQNEWIHSGNSIYIYSSVDPSSLGSIQISTINKLVNFGAAPYISFNDIRLSYANQFCIWGDGGNNKVITNNTFDHCNTGIFENNKTTSNPLIDGNTFMSIGSIAVYQYYVTNLTLTNNSFTDIGTEIGRMPYIGDFGSDSMWYTAIAAFPIGGLFEYNNLQNIGYSGFWLELPTNQVLVQHNSVENPCIVLTDCGAYYTYGHIDATASNINKITFRNNVARISNFSTTKWLTGYQGNSYGWLVEGFYKDGYLRATNWDNNFAYGFRDQYFSNPTKYSTWTNNVGVMVPTISASSRAFYINDIPGESQYSTNNQITGNTMVNAIDNNQIFFLYDAQLDAAAGDVFDYNTLLRPTNSWRGGMVYTYPSLTNLTFEQYKATGTVGIHEDTGSFFLNQTGLASTSEMVWIATNITKATSSVSFPGGYRYYTPSGDLVSSDSLPPYSGRMYYRTINQGMPQASSLSVSGGSLVGDQQTGTFTYAHTEGNTQSGTTYQWYRSSDGTKSARVPIAGATSATYTTSASDNGQSIILGVTPKSAAGTGSLLSGVERFSAAKAIVGAGSQKAITAFSITNPSATGVINEGAKTITVSVPYGTSLVGLIPSITITGASVSPASGAAQTFTSGVPVDYTVTASDASTQIYAVTVNVSSNPDKRIFSFDLNELNPVVTGSVNEGAKSISLTVPYGTPLSALKPTISVYGVSQLTSGSYSAYALKTDGSVWSWGYNGYGQLGNGTTTNSSLPTMLASLTGVSALSGGYYTSYALKSDGTVWAWGRNDFGQIGDGSISQRNTPTAVSVLTNITAVSGGYGAAYARRSDGTLWAWGANGAGQLGDNSTATSSIPVQVSSLTNVATTTGGYYSGYAIRTDGTVWSWGYNADGELGNNSTVNSSIPVQVSGLSGVVAVAAGRYSAYALKSDGSVWAWGGNAFGQLGNNSTATSTVPVQVSGLSNIRAIAAGRHSAYALHADGTVSAWGDNTNGQLGDNSTTQSNVPVSVSGLSGVISLGMHGGTFGGYVLKSDGSIWSWGSGLYGQIGDNLTTQQNAPVVVTTLQGSTVSPVSGVAHAFTDGVAENYTVTAADTSTQVYTVTVNVAPVTTYTLSLVSSGGVVTKSPDQTTYASGTAVSLTATPTSGYSFSGWTGAATSSSNPIVVTMDGNKTITANYTVIPSGGGGGGGGGSSSSSSGGGSLPPAVVPAQLTQGVSTSESPDGTILRFIYNKESLITIIGRDIGFDSRIVMLTTNTLLWTDKTTETLYVMYCTITAKCSNPIVVKVNTGKLGVQAQQSAVLENTTTTKPAVVAAPQSSANQNAFFFSRDLSYGMKHPDVLNLQRFLNTHNATVMSSGPGSPGKETTYFGYATLLALKKFQLAHAKELYGKPVSSKNVGGLGRVTRQYINKMR